MINLRAVKAIFKKDFLDGIKNYHIILMFFTPIVLSFLFSNVMSSSKSSAALPEIGVISSPQQPLIESIAQKGLEKKLKFFQNREELENAILDGSVRFGMILPEIISSKNKKNIGQTITLLYPPHIPDFGVESLKSTFEVEIRKQLGLLPPPLPVKFVTEAVGGANGKSGTISDNIFPMLLVMSMGMIGFLALPMSIVEEREKGTLNAIFLTPIRVQDFIMGKSLFSFFLALLTITSILTINQKLGHNFQWLLAFATLGTLMVIFIGLIIASFAKNQGSVNAIGTTLFLFFQMIPSLQHSSEVVKKIAPFWPSTYIFSGFRKALFLDLKRVNIYDDLTMVFAITLLTYLCAFFVYKFRSADK